jgi:small-conductance mechanosensitive channel
MMTTPWRSPVPRPRQPRWPARAALLAAVCLTLPSPARPASAPADAKPKQAGTKTIKLYRLTNEALLKQATAIYRTALRDYRAQFRALAAVEIQLDEVRRQTDAVKVSPPPTARTTAAPPPGEVAAKKALDAARARRAVVRKKLKLVETQKELLDRVTTRLEGCRAAVVAFQNAQGDLKAYALECRLRVKDGSLAEDQVPAELTAKSREKKDRQLKDDLAKLQTKSAEVRKGQKAVARLREATNKAALAAAADVVEASKNLLREQQRQELEKRYAGREPAALVPQLQQMVEEGMGLKGTYELALRKFQARQRTAERLRQELGALKPPAAKIPQLTRAEDVATAARSIRNLQRYYATRKKQLEALHSALAALAREGGKFEADAMVSEEHLFKMQVLGNLLKKNGVTDRKLPPQARAAGLDAAAKRQKKSAAAVRAATAKARAELSRLDRRRAEAAAAEEAAAKQLANLKESQEVTLAALKWEARLKDLTGTQVVRAFTATRKKLAVRLGKLKAQADGYTQAVAAVAAARTRLEGLKDPFLRAAEEQGQAEKKKLLAELRKEAGLERATRTRPAPPPAGGPKKANPPARKKTDTRTALEKEADRLSRFQQLLAGRVQVLDERQSKKKKLLTALDRLRTKAAAYARSLAGARLLALRWSATAVDLKKRFGKGELAADTLPAGITTALRLEQRTKLDAAATSVLNTLNQLQQERDLLRRPEPDGKKLTAATRDLLTVVGKRLDLLADLKRLAADYRRTPSARSPSERKRLEQRAADRRDAESSGWDTLLRLDASTTAKNLAQLLESYYRELIELEDKEENLTKQREKLERLLELTRKETAVLNRLLPLLARQVARHEAAREEEAVLARASLRPDRAEELLKAYQAKTGRLLPKPLPIPARDRAAKVDELGNRLFEFSVRLAAARKWTEVLQGRAAPTGLKAEAGVYQDEQARLKALSAANARRIQALTGPEESGPATGGEIGKTRRELTRIRLQGVKRTGIKILCILLAALLLPRLLTAVLRRAVGGTGDSGSSLALSALRAILKAAVWVVAITLILSTLGLDVTAILAGLGIGGLAIGLAAQSMIADVLGAFVIFAERRFKSGDVIRIGGDDPARVVGLTWRSTQVKNADGLLVTIPNRKVTEAAIQNLTRANGTYDSLTVSVTTRQDTARVLAVLRRALAECGQAAADHGVAVKEFDQKEGTKTIKYRFAWFLRDYEARDRTRDEVFARISASLAHEDMAGTEIKIS